MKTFTYESLVGSPITTTDHPAILQGKIFYRGSANDLRLYSIGPGTDESWGGTITSGPSVVETNPGQFDVFVRDAAGTVSSREQNALGVVFPWGPLGGPPAGAAPGVDGLFSGIVGAPVSISRTPKTIDLFARGYDDALWTLHFSSGWNTWTSLGGTLRSGPAVVIGDSGKLQVFVQDFSASVSAIEWSAGSWGPWARLPLPTFDPSFAILGEPAPIYFAPVPPTWSSPGLPSRVDVWVRTNSNALYGISRSFGTGWTAWHPFGGVLRSGISFFQGSPVVINSAATMSKFESSWSDFTPSLSPSDPWDAKINGAPAIEQNLSISSRINGVVRALSDDHMVLFYYKDAPT